MHISELKNGARKLIRDNAPKIFVSSIIFIVLITVMSELQFRLPGTVSAYERYVEQLASGDFQNLQMVYSYLRPSGVPLAVLLWILSSVLDAGFMSYCLKVTRGNGGDHKDVFDGFLYLGKVILIKIMTNFLILLWSFLFIFPGVVAFYRYRQAYYVLLDDPQKSALQCIRESKSLMHGQKLDLFLLDLSFIGWVLLDNIVIILLPLPFTLPLVSIWLTPYTGLARAAFYNQLLNRLAT